MEIQQREQNDIVILALSGKIIGGPDATLFNDKLHDLIESGKNKVIADLSQVDWMNSSGLGILISALTTIRNSGGDLKIANGPEKIKNLLTITKLVNVFPIYDTIEDAIASY